MRREEKQLFVHPITQKNYWFFQNKYLVVRGKEKPKSFVKFGRTLSYVGEVYKWCYTCGDWKKVRR